MKKMTLVIDEPGNCWECPCREVGPLGSNIICGVLRALKFTDMEDGRPAYCPLVEVAE